MNARTDAVEELQSRIGHTFADRELLERALTHSSVGKGAVTVRHNERLEFLGDRVLNLCVAEHIMAACPDYTEGELSKLMSHLVDYKTCAKVAKASRRTSVACRGPSSPSVAFGNFSIRN